MMSSFRRKLQWALLIRDLSIPPTTTRVFNPPLPSPLHFPPFPPSPPPPQDPVPLPTPMLFK